MAIRAHDARWRVGGFAGLLVGWCLLSVAWAQGEYTGRDLYAKPQAADPGGLVVQLAPGWPAIQVAVAIGRQSREPYRGQVADGRLTFEHLPVDRYDLVLVSADSFCEGVRLVGQPDAAASTAERPAIEAEIAKIEGFFDHKLTYRVEIEDTQAGSLVQQWRTATTLKQSGERVAGVIHSVDLIWFERPAKGWQLTKRRQVGRFELASPEPLRHVHLDALGDFRVVTQVKTVGPLAPPPANKE